MVNGTKIAVRSQKPVIHATVTDLDGIAVEDFSEFVLFREVFVNIYIYIYIYVITVCY